MQWLSSLAGVAAMAQLASARYIMYADQWHTANLGNATTNAGIDTAIMAFLPSTDFLTEEGGKFSLFEPVETFRARFDPGVKVLAAVGGWGDVNYTQTLTNETTWKIFAQNAVKVIEKYNLDGIDIDYEYPGGNGADYKTNPNSGKTWEIEAFPKFLAEIRSAIGKDKLLSLAVPGLERDMIAFTEETVPLIAESVDWFGIMTYDLMNRRDTHTLHHSDLVGSLNSIERYIARGLPACKATLGFAFYAKYFTTDPTSDCKNNPVGESCKTVTLENADGSDNGKSGALTFEPIAEIPTNLTVTPDGSCGLSVGHKCAEGYCCSIYGFCGNTDEYCNSNCAAGYGDCHTIGAGESWKTALANGVSDTVNGGHYYYHEEANFFWTWDEPEHIEAKFTKIIEGLGVKNVMAWSLAEDAADWRHLLAIQAGVKKTGLSEIEGFNDVQKRGLISRMFRA